MDVSIDKIVATYIKIRDAKEKLQQEFKQQEADLNEQLAVLKQQLLEISKATGATSFSTPNGTAYRTVKSRYWTNDWGSFYGFVREHGAMELLEKRIHQSNMREFLENNPELHPPNLNVDSEYEITIKRK
ncbi:MAG: hypothetical protein EBS78_11015 [Altererythrobacter sp.]|jgi:hypothetical protein|nr:hypothetical protein [Altererythrobacter sp.]